MAGINEEAREVWEYEIDALRHQLFQTRDEDSDVTRQEKSAIIACLIREYETRFGQPYPNTLNRL